MYNQAEKLPDGPSAPGAKCWRLSIQANLVVCHCGADGDFSGAQFPHIVCLSRHAGVLHRVSKLGAVCAVRRGWAMRGRPISSSLAGVSTRSWRC